MKNFDFSDDFFFSMGANGGGRNVFENFILKFLSVGPDRFGFGVSAGAGPVPENRVFETVPDKIFHITLNDPMNLCGECVGYLG